MNKRQRKKFLRKPVKLQITRDELVSMFESEEAFCKARDELVSRAIRKAMERMMHYCSADVEVLNQILEEVSHEED